MSRFLNINNLLITQKFYSCIYCSLQIYTYHITKFSKNNYCIKQ